LLGKDVIAEANAMEARMDQQRWLAERFETLRTHLQGVAYRMLGSRSEADDAVQEALLRLSRSDTSSVQNLAGWFKSWQLNDIELVN
jgi:DNA-directed RNA polymerase specialized sigma24 family protein